MPGSDAGASRATERAPGSARGVKLWQLPIRCAAAELLLGTIVATLVSGVLQAAISRLAIPMPSHMPTAIAAILSLLIVLAMAGLVVAGWRRWSLAATVGVWAGLAALITVVLALSLQGTQYYLGGISVDQAFRTQYLTRLTDSVLLRDMNYINTAPYYPAGWFWLGGRFANTMGLEGWEAYKPWSLLSMAVVPAVCFSLWSLVASRPAAVLLALATALVGLGRGAIEPYAWLVAGLLPPVGVIAFKAFSSGLQPTEQRSPGGHKAALVGIGLFLGMAGAVYTLHFGFASLVFVVLAVTALLRTRQTHGLWLAFRTLVIRLLIVGVVALPLVLLVWTPYLAQALTEGWPRREAASRYLPEAGALLPFPMLDFSVLGIVSLIGFGWLLLRFRSDDTARALGVLVLACYSWFALSLLAFAAGATLLPLRMLVPLTVALACAGVLGGLEGARAIYRQVRGDARRTVAIATSLLGVIGAVSVAQSVPQMHREMHRDQLQAAYADYYPTGVNALGEEDRSQAGAWYADLHETITTQTGKRPRGLVVLSDNYGLLALHPYWGFQQLTAHYANPLVDYGGRLAEVERWAEAKGSEDLLARLDSSPYRPPTVFVLANRSDGYAVTLTRDAFPKHPNVEEFDVVFDKALFSDDHFSKFQVGPFIVLVRR